MLLSELCGRIPGTVLSCRIAKEDLGLPEAILFLTEPCQLKSICLYLLDAADAQRILPECSAPEGSTVLCSGALPEAVFCQVNINLVSTDCGILPLHNAVSYYLADERRNNSMELDRLQRRFASIVEETFPGDNQVETICASFPKPVRTSYCIICVESSKLPGRAVRDMQMRSELKSLFSGDNITVYDNDTIIIHSYDGFTHPPELPTEELDALLKKYGACAGVSNGMRKTAQMRMMYLLAKKALESGKTLLGTEKRIFFYDDTMIFSLISMAAAGFQEQFQDDDIILLGSPIVVNIMKHDPQERRELLETLFQYIVNGGSPTKTAEAMHVHRNTVQNRISMVEELAGEQFTEDGMLQAKILITYYALQYYTKVLNKNLIMSPLIEGEDKNVRGKKE